MKGDNKVNSKDVKVRKQSNWTGKDNPPNTRVILWERDHSHVPFDASRRYNTHYEVSPSDAAPYFFMGNYDMGYEEAELDFVARCKILQVTVARESADSLRGEKGKDRELKRIKKLQGNQPKILLLYLLSKGFMDSYSWNDLQQAFEIAESYHPDHELHSF